MLSLLNINNRDCGEPLELCLHVNGKQLLLGHVSPGLLTKQVSSMGNAVISVTLLKLEQLYGGKNVQVDTNRKMCRSSYK
jgi:hypothetical protein